MDTRTLANEIRSKGSHEAIVIAEAISALQAQLDKAKKDLETLTSAVSGISVPEAPRDSSGARITFVSATAALTDPTDYGLRFWMITCTYTTSLTNLRFVAAYVENPKDSAPVRIAQAQYVAGGTHTITFVLNPSDVATDVRIYLIPVLDGGEGQLLSVADYGEQDSSPHRTVSIGPVPTETQGVEWTDNVTGQVATVSTYLDSNGITRTRLTATFTRPTDPRWGGVEIDARRPGPVDEQLARTSVSPAAFPVESPVTQQTWRIFFRSYDKQGKTNTLNTGGTGTPTPYVDITIGSNTGTFDAGKIQQSTLSSALQVVTGVLGITPLGITTDLIAQFAISQAKLANAPIIDAVRIIDGAVTNAKIQNLAANKILAGTLAAGVIYAGTLSANQITSGTISASIGYLGTLHASQITGWSGETLYASGGLTISGPLTLTGGDVSINNQPGFGFSIGDLLFVNYQIYGSTWVANFHAVWADTDIRAGSKFIVGAKQVVGARLLAVSNTAVTIPTSGSVTADSYTGNAYNVVNELQDKVNTILARLRTHGLIET